MNHRHFLFLCVLSISILASGCSGYTSKTQLPEHIKSIYVDKVRNEINIASEVSSDKPFQTYRPGLEIELRNALIERFIFDGHLKVGSQKEANAVLRASLIDFERVPVRYNADDSIQEFRIYINSHMKFVDQTTNKVLWEGSVGGSTNYFNTGERSVSEDEAVEDALEDLVRHAVEEILEVW